MADYKQKLFFLDFISHNHDLYILVGSISDLNENSEEDILVLYSMWQIDTTYQMVSRGEFLKYQPIFEMKKKRELLENVKLFITNDNNYYILCKFILTIKGKTNMFQKKTEKRIFMKFIKT
jgi:hypothetical protein